MTAKGVIIAEDNGLTVEDMLIKPDVLDNNGNLLVPNSSDITEWTFENQGEDKYYITRTIDGQKKYLTISGASVSFEDAPSEYSLITAVPGTGKNSGKWHFSVNNYYLNVTGTAVNAVTNASSATTWLNLVEKTTLTEDDFVNYSARKISASDEILSDKDQAKVIVYTRVWNDSTKKYEYYAVDHDGSLVRVYDSGDLINWVGNQVNSALWAFTEYTYDDGTPSWYYELENTAYPNTFLAPQSSGIISSHTVGLNLEGRKDGFDYTTIVAWDDNAYAYSGLKVEGNKVVTCPLEDADDFYFAVMVPPVEEADPLTTVETVDNTEHGITIRMVDFNTEIKPYNGNNLRDSVQFEFFGAHSNQYETGLLSTNLTNGYPTTTEQTGNAGHSLSELFTGMTSANHLFIQSVYNESGYFEYDSTQNFAHLNPNGNFTVYNQLGAIGKEKGESRAHGQFMPYNDISAELGYAYDSSGKLITNRYNVLKQELSDTDPRKGEPLYLIPGTEAEARELQRKLGLDYTPEYADYFFGMELSASFTQTPNGLDNWGHDIIFEFTGDDDFWFYVDGELVLDLGGIHSALPGSVNFRTGEVNINGTWKTLRDIFRENYIARGYTPEQADTYVDGIFEQKLDDNGNPVLDTHNHPVYTFKDYTTHTMKMFYMERGAGASNLKMRFNLASVQPGTAELTKKLSGTESASNKLMQYPYQIWYATANYETNPDGSYVFDEQGNRKIIGYSEPMLLKQPDSNSNLTGAVYAVYKGTKTLIPYAKSMTIDGQTYTDVFLLKPGETAVLNFPENTYRYKIVECGVNTEVYEKVSVNGEEIIGEPNSSSRSDFGISYATTVDRPRVEYTNQVAPDVMRTLSFKKVLYDTKGQLMLISRALFSSPKSN